MTQDILSVSEITGLIRKTLEVNFSEVNIVGEISNFKAHVSGHWYFTLKDSDAQVSCTMWRGKNNYVFFTPQDGMKIIISGKLTVYPPRGSYQIDIRSMKPAGIGELQAAFERLKQKLASEGLFDEIHKKPIPNFPGKIGIVTAIDGAAFQDMKSIAARRYPIVELVIVPCKVQGEKASDEIVESINLLNKQNDIDVIIVGRGGGSLEDLWAFNEETVARAIFNSRIPIISAVGHEIDFTIADFVADLRAPTPSVAMELATPDANELFTFISGFSGYFRDKMQKIISNYRTIIDQTVSSYGFRLPQNLIKNKIQNLDNIHYRFQNSFENKLDQLKNRLSLLNNIVELSNVDRILKKGFVIISQDGKFITRSQNIIQDKSFDMKFYDGEIKING
jgi:exodeoxyribonuclease VII large subunit